MLSDFSMRASALKLSRSLIFRERSHFISAVHQPAGAVRQRPICPLPRLSIPQDCAASGVFAGSRFPQFAAKVSGRKIRPET